MAELKSTCSELMLILVNLCIQTLYSVYPDACTLLAVSANRVYLNIKVGFC